MNYCTRPLFAFRCVYPLSLWDCVFSTSCLCLGKHFFVSISVTTHRQGEKKLINDIMNLVICGGSFFFVS